MEGQLAFNSKEHMLLPSTAAAAPRPLKQAPSGSAVTRPLGCHHIGTCPPLEAPHLAGMGNERVLHLLCSSRKIWLSFPKHPDTSVDTMQHKKGPSRELNHAVGRQNILLWLIEKKERVAGV